MKQHLAAIIFLLLLSLILFSCKSDNPVKPVDGSSLYTPSDSARMYFLADATDLAVEHLFETLSPDTSKVLVPDSILNKYFLPLACLYDNRKEIPLIDTLITQKRIHKLSITSTRLTIGADTSFEWVRNIRNSILPTGNAVVDSLAQLYHLSFNFSFDSWVYDGLIYFNTVQPPVNIFALGRAFLAVPGVVSIDPFYYLGGDSNLEVLPTSSVTTIHLYKGYGDCQAGCAHYERWSFSVNDKFEVQYLGHM